MDSATFRWIFVEGWTCSNYRTDTYSSLDDAWAECKFDNTCGGITENNEDNGYGYFLCNYGTFYDFPTTIRGFTCNVYKKG